MIKNLRCTNCGVQQSLESKLDDNTVVCKVCTHSFPISQGHDLNKLESFNEEVLKKLRSNLKASLDTDDLNGIHHFSREIITLIPNDYRGKYYNAYSKSKLESNKALMSFFKKEVHESTANERKEISHHMATNIDVRDKKAAIEYLKKNTNEDLENFNLIINQRIELENNYALVPKDIFICHRSIDKKTALNIVEVLEKDGNKCWISTRNLRPNDNENYKKNIEEAIQLSKIFLVISSEDSMNSKDVQDEIYTAMKFKKKRLEFKIDDSIHTTLFQSFFDGIKWIYSSKEDSHKELLARVFDLLKNEVISNKNSEENTLSKDTYYKYDSNTKSIIKKMYFEVNINNYEAAIKLIDQLLSINQEIEDAWIGKLLIQEKNSDFDKLIAQINNYSLNELESLINSTPFKALESIDKKNPLIVLVLKKIETEIKFEKNRALNELDINYFSQLSTKYKEIIDYLYKALIKNNFRDLKVFESYLSQTKHIEELKNIFEDFHLRQNENDPVINEYFKKYELLLETFEIEKIEEKEKNRIDENQKNFVFINEKRKITKSNSFSTIEVVIPKFIDKTPVEIIGDNAFFMKDIHQLKIGDKVKTIGIQAFKYNKLTDVNIPNSVEIICDDAFNYNQINSLTIGNNVKTIGNNAFRNNKLTDVNIPNSVEIIGDNAFDDNPIKRLTIGNNVKEIPFNAFYWSGINKLSIVDSKYFSLEDQFILNLDKTSLLHAYGYLESIKIPKGVEIITSYVFNNRNIRNLLISDEVKMIGRFAFNSNKLIDLKIPNSVEIIDDYAFRNNLIKTLQIGDNVKVIEGAFDWSKIEYLNIGNNKEFIVENNLLMTSDKKTLLAGIGKLKKVIIPEGIEVISKDAFFNNDLKKIDIPKSVHTIGKGAFGSNKLRKVVIPKNVLIIGDYAFYNNRLINVVIKGNKKRFYLERGGFPNFWKKLLNILRFI